MLAMTGGFVDIVIKSKRYARTYFAPLLSLAMLSSAGTAVSGQTTQPMQPKQPPANQVNPSPVGPTPRPWTPPPDDITRREIADMNNFLDSHPEIAEQLRKDPSLIDNRQWVANHPALQEYVKTHPDVAQAFRANPNLFMRDEDRVAREQGGYGITRHEVTDMSHFLDSHPEIAEQLRRDPSLIDNRQWVANHPALQEYMKTHPDVTQAFRANPNLFMRDEDRVARGEGGYGIPRHEVTDMSHFLDSHPEIAEQLRRDPSLIDNRQWVSDHPALQEYLKTHPDVADQFRANPVAFMRDEDRYEHQTGDRDQLSASNRDERNRGELTSFGQFLGGHSNMAADLSSDPSLANNKEYLASHPELNEYLQAHPTVSQQLAQDPQSVMTSTSVQQSGGFSAKPVGPTPKPKTETSPNQ